jgi:hypothetical protein
MSKIFDEYFDINLSRIKRKENKPYFNNLEKQKLFLNFDSRINNKSNERNQFTIDSNKSNNVEYISSSELYTLPNYKTKTLNFFHRAKKAFSNKNKKNKIRNDIYHINKNFRFITSNDVEEKKKNDQMKNYHKKVLNNIHTLSVNSYQKRKKPDQFANLPNFMKDRFYSDIQEKFNIRFHKNPFYYDISIKDKIIQLHQIREFWGGMSDYTNPILSTKKVRFISKLIEDRKNLRDNKKKDEESKNFVNGIYHKFIRKRNVNVTMPKLYTNSNFIEEKMEEIRKKKLSEKSGKNKTEDNMMYVK